MGSMILAGLALNSCQKGEDTTSSSSIKLENELDSVSYVLGQNIGTNLEAEMKTIPGGVNLDALIAGISQKLKNDSTNLIPEEEGIQEMMQKHFQKAAEEESVKRQAENEVYLAENKTKPGVVETASGLQYKVITEGTGDKPKADDLVTVHYTGKLIDGTVFDSSVQKGQPAQFYVGRVIPGWTEALQLMSVGSKYELTIPSKLAYGERSAGPIPANSVLIFEVELLDIAKK